MKFFNFLMLLAFDCGIPTSNVSNLKQKFVSGSPPISQIYLTSTLLECFVGYKWTDGIQYKNTTCQANGIWSKIQACISKLVFMKFDLHLDKHLDLQQFCKFISKLSDMLINNDAG